jgi:prepilin-type N-terminal cleavage/methylation domain-containing protein
MNEAKHISKGFTLIELMVSMAMVGILVALAAPSFQQTIRVAAVDSHIENIVNIIQNARGEAVKRGVSVSITAPGNWTTDATIFLDANSDQVLDPTEQQLRTTTLTNSRVRVSLVTGVLNNGVRFNGQGRLDNNNRILGGRLEISGDDGVLYAIVCVNGTGRNHVLRKSGATAPDPNDC